MKKIKLTDKAKLYLVMIDNDQEITIRNKEQVRHLALLENEGLIENYPTKDDEFGYGNMEITTKGKAYLATNPTLDDPSILDDKEFVFSTAISIIKEFFL